MRKTENEIIKLQQAGFYRDIELPDPSKEQDNIKKAKDKETGFSDLNDMFGGSSSRRGRTQKNNGSNLKVELTITFEEAVFGATKEINYERM
jgi:DnaJ-class molecular chaperone